VLAAEMRAGQLEIEAQEIDEMAAHLHVSRNRFAVDGKAYFGGFFGHGKIFALTPPLGKARPVE
jgi:hypothetical protein